MSDDGEKKRSKQVARQLDALMRRHGFTPGAWGEARRFALSIGMDDVTIRRLLAADAKTAPRFDTLDKIAQAVGEPLVSAFPIEDEHTARLSAQGSVEAFIDGKRDLSQGEKEFLTFLAQVIDAGPAAWLEIIRFAKRTFSRPVPAHTPEKHKHTR